MATTDATPTLTDVAAAVDLMTKLAADHDWVSVFWDKGWGDATPTSRSSSTVTASSRKPGSATTSTCSSSPAARSARTVSRPSKPAGTTTSRPRPSRSRAVTAKLEERLDAVDARVRALDTLIGVSEDLQAAAGAENTPTQIRQWVPRELRGRTQ